MADIKLSYERVQTIAEQLKTSSETMRDILTAIDMELSKVGDEETWSGMAANTTKTEFDALKVKFPEFVEAVESCHTYLTQTVIPNFKAVDSVVTGKKVYKSTLISAFYQ